MNPIQPETTQVALIAGKVLVAIILLGWMKYTFLIHSGVLAKQNPSGWWDGFKVALGILPLALGYGFFAFVLFDIIQPMNSVLPPK